MTDPPPLPAVTNDPSRLSHLRTQLRPERVISASLSAALGGASILPGREMEAWEIWKGLCERSRSGDVGAGEDMAHLTALLCVRLPGVERIDECISLSQTAFESAGLPRHRQEQLGRIVRLRVRQGDKEAALAALSQMQIQPPGIESDSELRVAGAAVASLLGEYRPVLAFLGAGHEVPIIPALSPLAIALRANAHEALGDVMTAAEQLKALPHQSMLSGLRESLAPLNLCPRSYELYGTLQAANRVIKKTPLDTALLVGPLLLACAALCLFRLLHPEGRASLNTFDFVFLCVIVVVAGFLGYVITLVGIDNRKQALRVKASGIPLLARVARVEGTSTKIGHLPVYKLILEVSGPNGPYSAEAHKTLHAHEASAMVGRTLPVLADPEKPTEVFFE